MGFFPNKYCFTALIRAYSNTKYFDHGLVVFGFLLKTGYFDSPVSVGCGLIDMFFKGCGDVESARLGQLGLPGDAIDLFLSMFVSGYMPDRFTLSGVVLACAKLELLSVGKELHYWVIRYDLGLDLSVCCSLVDMHAKCGAIEDSRKVFNGMSDHNVMSWTALISGYVRVDGQEQEREAIRLFCDILRGSDMPNCFMFAGVLKACANLPNIGFGKQLHGQTIELGLSAIDSVGNALVNMYARFGRMESASNSFDILFEKNLVSCSANIGASVKNLYSEDALNSDIEYTGVGASSFTYASLLSGAACISSIGKGEQIHATVVKLGLETDQFVNNALISMYSKCGNKEASLQVLNGMDDRNVVTWTSIINSFAKHGFGTKALELFHEMLETGMSRTLRFYQPVVMLV